MELGEAAAMERSTRPGAPAAFARPPGLAAIGAYRDDEKLAIYDWMQPAGTEALLLADPAATQIEAAIRGDLFEGSGRSAGLRLRDTAAPVRLPILCSRLLPRRWPVIDAWAGPCYRRVTVEADYLGLVVRTQVYVLKEAGLY